MKNAVTIPIFLDDLKIGQITKDDKDYTRYIKFTDIEALQQGLDGRIRIAVKAWEYVDYEIHYCVECLLQGVKNSEWVYLGKEYLCKEHRRQQERVTNPCPKCDKGFIQRGFEEEHCSERCGYYKSMALPGLLFAGGDIHFLQTGDPLDNSSDPIIRASKVNANKP